MSIHYNKISIFNSLWQFSTKCDRFYYKMRKLFYTKCDKFFVTKCDSFITNCDNFVKKFDSYYKMRRLLQIATVQTCLLVKHLYIY